MWFSGSLCLVVVEQSCELSAVSLFYQHGFSIPETVNQIKHSVPKVALFMVVHDKNRKITKTEVGTNE